MWCLAADTHLKLLDRVVSDACFLAGGVLNCDLSHRRSAAVLCMLYKIRCNTMHPLCGALPVLSHRRSVAMLCMLYKIRCNPMHPLCGALPVLSHRRSVAVLCMLYKIRCNPMHPLCGALPVPYVPFRVTRGSLIAHRYTYALPRCRTSQ